jgi:hypothetical protein
MTRLRRRRACVAFGATVMLAAARGSAAATCHVTQDDFDHNGTQDLRIVGTAPGQALRISDAGDNTTLRLDCNGDGDFKDPGELDGTTTFSSIETIDVRLGARASLTYNQSQTFSGLRKGLAITLAAGGNLVAVNGVDGTGLEAGASLAVDVLGGAGADRVLLNYGRTKIDGGFLALRGDLGAGDDAVSVLLPSDVSLGDVDIDIGLSAGRNTVAFGELQGVTTQTISQGTVRIDVDGGDAPAGTDTVVWGLANATLTSASHLDFNARLRGGNDGFRGSLGNLNVGGGSAMRFRVNGGAGNDALLLTDEALAVPDQTVGGLLEAALLGGVGADTISMDLTALAGNGTFRARAEGGDQNDFALLSAATNPASTCSLDLIAHGGAGNDYVYAAVVQGGANDYGALGAATIDGAFGTDECAEFGVGTRPRKLDCEGSF